MSTDTYPNVRDHEVAHGKPAELVRVSWAGIFAGAVVGIAVVATLTLLGMSIGFGVIDPTLEENPLAGVGTGSAIWAALTMIAGLFVGGFVAARLAGQPNPITAVLHGATVWSLVTVAIIWLASTAIGGLVGGSLSAISSGASAAGSAVASATQFAGQQIGRIDISMPNQLPDGIEQRLEQRDLTPEDLRREFNNAIAESALGQEDLNQLRENAAETAREVAQNPGNAGAIVQDFIENLTGSGEEVVVSDEERQQIVDRLVRRTGITRAEAANMIDEAQARFNEARGQIVSSLEEARETTLQAAEAALNGLTKAAFWSFFGLVLGLIAAAGGAFVGAPKTLPRARV
ncbi:hypothetical protein [Paracoccus sediminicola]|uniref:hypothetical protein n=1 Tax=Paracoccus sediminicola TaxID=3017783 RepID=UPI0022F0F310|nr:hypothetical protein [Paracoccus sediminicola]WBU55699.1 hypothetical protein PAF18_09180 [Paracoccus sediminicola]